MCSHVQNNVGVLRSLETVSADLSLGASIHSADARGQSGAQQARLRQRRSGRPSSLLDAQATFVQNASARLIYRLRRSDHISDALLSLHWLRVPERIEYKIAVPVYNVLNGLAPRYLGPLTRFADLPGRRAVRSAGSNRLHIPPVRLSTVVTRVFSVAGPRIWNNLPEYITSAGTPTYILSPAEDASHKLDSVSYILLA